MAITITQRTSGLAAWGANLLNTEYLEKRFVEALKANTMLAALGVRSTLPEGTSTVVRWNEFTAPTAGTTANTEGTDFGTTATSVNLVTVKYEATLLEYIAYEEISRLGWRSAMSGTMDEMASLLGYRAGISVDALTFQEVDGSSTSVDSLTGMTASSVRAARGTLRKNKARPHRSTPGGRFFCGAFSPEAASDMMGEGSPAWWQVKSEDYSNALVTPWEGTPATAAIYGVLIKECDNVQAVSAEDLNLVFGDEAFGVASLDSDIMKPQVVVQDPSTNQLSKARNWGYLSYVFFYVAKLFGNSKTVVVKSDVT